MTAPPLDASSISVSFGGVRACDEISIALAAGETVGLTGPNGSGKSTFLNAVVGLVDASGHVEVDGEPVPLGVPAEVRRRGVVRTFQAPQNWTSLSVLENVVLGSDDRAHTGLVDALLRRRAVRRHEIERWRRGTAALDRVGLGDLVDASADALTYGQQRMLELARAMVAEPKVLLLDEPAAGLNAEETGFLASVLGRLASQGIAVLVIDHKIDFLDTVCDRIVVLQLGQVIAEGVPAEIWKQPGVIDAYLGRETGSTQ